MKIRAIRASLLACAAAALGACADGSPVAVVEPGPAEVTARLLCTASVREATVSCAPEQPSAGGASAVILGTPYVQVLGSGASYNGTDTWKGMFSVLNNTTQSLGTTNGVDVAPNGVRIFVAAGPTVTGGTGTVSVANATGTATFTAPGQPYFQYDEIVFPMGSSSEKEWRFNVPNTVLTFQFTLYVAAPVTHENGYVEVPSSPVKLALGGSQFMTATVRHVSGQERPDAVVTWTTSDASKVQVTPGGKITGVGTGTATLTATSGSLTATVTVNVVEDATTPYLRGFTYTPDSLFTGSGPDTLTFDLRLEGVPNGGLHDLILVMQHLGSSQTQQCGVEELVSGTATSGTWRCSVVFPQGSGTGTWSLRDIRVVDPLGSSTLITSSHLGSAGYGYQVHVNGVADHSAPVLTGLAFSTDTLDVSPPGADSIQVTFQATDAGTGLSSLGILFEEAGTGQSRQCGSPTLVSGNANGGTWTCWVLFPDGSATGTWRVRNVLLIDRVGNATDVNSTQLGNAGFPTSLEVTGGTQDLAPPQLTGLSLSPDPLHVGTAADELLVTLQATDALSPITSISVQLRHLGSSQTRSCGGATLVSGTATSGTWTCTATFPQGSATGTWQVQGILLGDAAGNFADLDTDDLQAAGITTNFQVEP